jgi:hypothetical protein
LVTRIEELSLQVDSSPARLVDNPKKKSKEDL